MKYWEGKDFFGGDIESKTGVETVEECAKSCFNNSECVVFTYGGEHERFRHRCWLKKAQDKWTVNQSPGLISGHKCGYDFTPIQYDVPTGVVETD